MRHTQMLCLRASLRFSFPAEQHRLTSLHRKYSVPRDVYIKKILTPNAWGGAIELSIFSKHFRVEIDSIDVATGVVHRFGEDEGYPQRCIVIYSGMLVVLF